MEKYVFRKYLPQYEKYFAKEKNKLQRLLPGGTIIEHVGSTAVHNLGGKGIVDIVIAVPRNQLLKTAKKLSNAGYELRKKASTKYRLFFRRDYSSVNGARRIHIHLTIANGRDLEEMVLFRNYLITHPKETEMYATIKKKAAKFAKQKGKAYRNYKKKFIDGITRKARLKAIAYRS